MQQDAQTSAAALHAPALSRYQLYALLRLRMAHEQQSAESVPPGRALQRFKAFELLVEKHFATWHQLPRYAQQLGCSEKSLVRASLEAAVRAVTADVIPERRSAGPDRRAQRGLDCAREARAALR